MTKATRPIQEENPREWDNLGTMVCFHRRYSLGDPPGTGINNKHNITDPEELRKLVASREYLSLPLYLYDHSGITIRTTPFGDPWDSGQVGNIIVSREDVRKKYGVSRISWYTKVRVEKVLQAEVKVYDQFLTGETEEYDTEEEEDDDDA